MYNRHLYIWDGNIPPTYWIWEIENIKGLS